uniref:histidine kinase n=1 Tax=Caulobacter sp. (strain K31) TaxID=366602 RepID=B0T6I8_CAUSK
MLNISVKSTAQRQAEAEVDGFRQNLGPFVVAAQTSRAAMVFTDATASGNPIIFANDAFLSMTGYAREEVLGQAFNFLMVRGANQEVLAQIDAAFAGDSQGYFEICDRRKDGSIFWTAIVTNPVQDESGAIVQHFASFVDLTGKRREAEHLRFLLDELNHRTQNTLTSVLAIAAQTLRGKADKALVEAFEGRVLALAKAHTLLGRDNWEAVSLRDVLERILGPFDLENDGLSRFTLEGGEACLAPKAALTLAMVFHELATNAMKYGALSDARGHVLVTWRIAPTPGGDRLTIRWQEGGGPSVVPPSHRGFGSRLIERGLAQDLNGEVHVAYDAAGVTCQIAMPLPPARTG